jgi:Fe2+ transport system protein FeoA
MPIPLTNANIGPTYRVVAVEGRPEAARRIRELGLIVGADCRVIRRSPFGGPMEVALNHRRLGLRLADLTVLVEPAF